MSELHELYQATILDHNRQPRNFRAIDGARTAEGYNRMCGDRVIVYVRVEDDVVVEASFQGTGCAISRASASLMTESVTGQGVARVQTLCDRVQRMLVAPPGGPIDPLGPLIALAGVRQFPIRVKCALLAWQVLRAAIDQSPLASR